MPEVFLPAEIFLQLMYTTTKQYLLIIFIIIIFYYVSRLLQSCNRPSAIEAVKGQVDLAETTKTKTNKERVVKKVHVVV